MKRSAPDQFTFPLSYAVGCVGLHFFKKDKTPGAAWAPRV